MQDVRTIFIGDVHGCADELCDLLDATRYQSGDRLVLVGDLVVRGPHSKRVVELARREGASMVKGNHDARVLDACSRDLSAKHPLHARVAETLDADDIAYLETAPLWLDFPAHGVRALHAGIDPEKPIEAQDEKTLLTVRHIRGTQVLWGERYKGPPHIIFGHHAMEGLQLHAWATGLDTGCVYGGKLTALVLSRDEPVARGKHARAANVVSVRARATYFDPNVE
jgi:hypothetical protein